MGDRPDRLRERDPVGARTHELSGSAGQEPFKWLRTGRCRAEIAGRSGRGQRRQPPAARRRTACSSNVTISNRLAGAFAAIGLLLAALGGSRLRAASSADRPNPVADQLDADPRRVEVKFNAADLNGWQTAYAFDVARGRRRRRRRRRLPQARSSPRPTDARRVHAARRPDALTTTRHAAAGAKAAVRPVHGARRQDHRRPTAPATPTGSPRPTLVAVDEMEIFGEMTRRHRRGHRRPSTPTSEAGGPTPAAAQPAAHRRARRRASWRSCWPSCWPGSSPARSPTRSSELRERLAQIADGDGDLTQRLDEDRSDELGAVAAAFNRFVDKIAGAIRPIADHSVVIASASEELSAVSAGRWPATPTRPRARPRTRRPPPSRCRPACRPSPPPPRR